MLKIFTHTPKHPYDPYSYLKNNYIKITFKKYTYKSENTLMIPFHAKQNNRVKKHTHKLTPLSNIHIAPFRIKNNF